MKPSSRIAPLVRKHERLRAPGINLIASENCLSPEVSRALSGDLAGRYHSDFYGGSKYAQAIIEETERLARKLFHARHAMVTPVSGTVCDLAAMLAFTRPSDTIAMVPFSAGGFPLGAEKFGRRRVFFRVDEVSYEVDAARAKKLISDEKVKLTILGSSYMLFPHPVAELAGFIGRSGRRGRLVYDGSHVLGLVACGAFQDPLREGAEVLFGSTHKSFYGPQGGIMLTNSAGHDRALRALLEIDLKTGIGLVDNPHANRIAALGLAIEEMLADRGYGGRVVDNARALAKALDELGVPVRFAGRVFTQSHQVLLDLRPGRAKGFCHDLEGVGIFIDTSGRLGVAEATHRGLGPSDMAEVAELMAEVYKRRPREQLRKRVRRLANR